MIYKSLEQRSDEEITVHISYMEIYQEVAYDLLNPGARTFSPVTPLPRVGFIIYFSIFALVTPNTDVCDLHILFSNTSIQGIVCLQ